MMLDIYKDIIHTKNQIKIFIRSPAIEFQKSAIFHYFLISLGTGRAHPNSFKGA